jgi:hypothetical protein
MLPSSLLSGHLCFKEGSSEFLRMFTFYQTAWCPEGVQRDPLFLLLNSQQLLARDTFLLWRWRQYILSKHRTTSVGLNGVSRRLEYTKLWLLKMILSRFMGVINKTGFWLVIGFIDHSLYNRNRNKSSAEPFFHDCLLLTQFWLDCLYSLTLCSRTPPELLHIQSLTVI